MDQDPQMSAELALPKYNLNAEQEKNEIVRHYRALSRSLRPKLKKGDKKR
jgi:GTP pyrophosphokinase